jgi:F-type H+-transporting ATPase subunit beta
LESQADVAIADQEGRTPADLAALRRDPRLIELLVAHGAKRPATLAQTPTWMPGTASSLFLATGIKAVDLFAPLPRGGFAGVFTPLAGAGFVVLLDQLIASLREVYDGIAIYLGLESYEGYADGVQLSWQELGVNDRATYLCGRIEDSEAERMQLAQRGLAAAQERCQAGHEVLLLLGSNLACTPGVLPYLQAHAQPSSRNAITFVVHGHYTVGVLPEPLADLTSVITFSRMLVRQRLFPAIDPVRSYSRLFERELAGSLHAEATRQSRRLLQRYMDLHPVFESGGIETLWYIDDDPQVEQTILRARRLQRFLTQPFYGTEPWTGLLGQLVPLEETIRGCQAILHGEYDALPEEAFYMIGAIDQAVAKARKID